MRNTRSYINPARLLERVTRYRRFDRFWQNIEGEPTTSWSRMKDACNETEIDSPRFTATSSDIYLSSCLREKSTIGNEVIRRISAILVSFPSYMRIWRIESLTFQEFCISWRTDERVLTEHCHKWHTRTIQSHIVAPHTSHAILSCYTAT